MREVKVPIVRENVTLEITGDYNKFLVPSSLSEAVTEAKIKIAECKCDKLPCTMCATLEVLLSHIERTK